MGIALNIKKWAKRSRFMALQKGMATVIVTGNNLPSNVTKGQYVLIQDSTITGVSDGLYKATANISSGTLSDGSSLSSISSGLCGEVATLNDQIANLFKIKTVSFASSAITANSVFSVTKAVNADTGYKPLCVAGTGLARVAGINFTGIYVSGGTSVIVMGYNGTAATSFNGDVFVLCVKE